MPNLRPAHHQKHQSRPSHAQSVYLASLLAPHSYRRARLSPHRCATMRAAGIPSRQAPARPDANVSHIMARQTEYLCRHAVLRPVRARYVRLRCVISRTAAAVPAAHETRRHPSIAPSVHPLPETGYALFACISVPLAGKARGAPLVQVHNGERSPLIRRADASLPQAIVRPVADRSSAIFLASPVFLCAFCGDGASAVL